MEKLFTIKQFLILLVILVIISGCKKDKSTLATPSSHRLKSCFVEYLIFRDDIRFSSFESLSFEAVDTDLYCSYVYDAENVRKVQGGFVPVPQGTNLISYIFTGNGYDSIAIQNNGYYVYAKVKYSDSLIFEYTSNPVIYFLDSQNKIIKINKKSTFYPNGYDLNYTYSDTTITETGLNGMITRIFYIKNGDLVKVISDRYYPPGVLSNRKEILFEDFDNNPNPFKGKYYVSGAFFRAFSEHNFQSYTINMYGLMPDSTFAIYQSNKYTTPLSYTTDGYPKFGIYE